MAITITGSGFLARALRQRAHLTSSLPITIIASGCSGQATLAEAARDVAHVAEIVRALREDGVAVYLSTTRRDQSAYSRAKQVNEAIVRDLLGPRAIILALPRVYDLQERMPQPLGPNMSVPEFIAYVADALGRLPVPA